ncbi:SDR family oxidoreductase [Aeromicrobium fastidiosum]|uniref:SDR family oxidoreductase n=1 Tax=Aeromicrobium fastidiosum TaxID=52699 RepID=A0A641APN4_9ACTN|nr:SDR family oxidoreductase [Aeromicrobium fastidiosum]KAA1379895.1 SDR family oxidoreductase [Aeromicrobium fastidiosum]MBP2389400.1 NAD(P)-dependent dehydrogenase (short-subunit alcohol dehydrogenase family) [Aeromicrobium fastidiosum]
MSNNLQGMTAIITGGSRGIGRSIAEAYVAQGARVVITSRQQEALDQVAEEIRSAYPGAEVLPFAAHVGDPDQSKACVDAAMAEYGRVDILVNNAGTCPQVGPLVTIDAWAAEKMFQVNQLSVLLWTRLVWEASMRDHGGRIINMASIGGLITEPGIGFYNSTKAAVLHLTRQFAVELGPDVRVNAIAPGLVRTEMVRALWEANEENFKERLPLGRIGEPEDIASAAVFLASDASSWMTGQSMVIDGGALVGHVDSADILDSVSAG